MDTSFLTARNGQVALAIGLLASAEAEAKRLEALQEKQATQEAQLQAELDQLEAEMGSKVLAGIEAGKDITKAVAAEVESKRLQLEMAKAVSLALLPKIAGAKRAVIVAKASVLRFEAGRLEQHAQERQAKTDEMLKALEDWEGCDFTYNSGATQQAMVGNRTTGAPSVFMPRVPLTLKILNRSAALQANADALEQGRPLPTDLVTGDFLAPFVIDYEGGRVLIPEPIAYEPIKWPRAGKPEMLEKATARKGVTFDDVAEWRQADNSPVAPEISHLEG